MCFLDFLLVCRVVMIRLHIVLLVCAIFFFFFFFFLDIVVRGGARLG